MVVTDDSVDTVAVIDDVDAVTHVEDADDSVDAVAVADDVRAVDIVGAVVEVDSSGDVE